MTKTNNPYPDENLVADADVDTAAVGSETGQTQAGAGAAYRSAGAETIGDIGQAEAYITNLKGVVEDAIALRKAFDGIAIQMAQNAANEANRRQSFATGHDNRLMVLAEGEQSRTVRHSDLAIDRHWNIDEVSMAALSATIATAVANALASQASK